MDELNAILETLLGENGCPWDKKQTHESFIPYLSEECQELTVAVAENDFEGMKEELGDVLLQVVFHAKLAEKAGRFTFAEVVKGLCEKLVRRHTHVFGDEKASSVHDVLRIWEKNKRLERKSVDFP
jgi:MazG family protein